MLSLILVSVGIAYPPLNILSWDVFGHYLYLPALFIYNDLGLKETGFVHDILAQYNNSATFYQVVMAPTGSVVIKYTSGLAIFYLPFFFIGHFLAIVLGFPADGFSLPYQYAVFGGCLLYSITGLYFLRKVLLEFFKDPVVAVVLILVFLGTNYFSESVFKGAMSHNLLFTLYAVILWLTIQWHKNFRFRDAVLLGLTTGLASMIRPTDVVCVMIPVLWGITDRESLINKIRMLFKYRFKVIIAAIGFLVALSPQLIYWKIFTGKFFFYSYDNPGEGFEFLRPYLANVLFSFRKGWLVYTPMMIFSIIGFYFLFKQNRKLFLPFSVYFILNLYLVSSWSCWWYAESFGQRSLVQSYVVMSVSLGYFVSFVQNKTKALRIITLVIFLFFIMLNLFQTWQLNHGIIHGSRMTRAYYMAVFGKTKMDPDLKNLLLVERSAVNEEYFKASSGYLLPKTLFFNDFENAEPGSQVRVTDSLAYSGKYCLKMTAAQRFSPGFNIAFKDLTAKDHAWIRASAYVFPVSGLENDSLLMVVTFSHDEKYYKYRAASFANRHLNIVKNQWNLLTLDYLTPEVRSVNDILSVYVWYRGAGEVFIDDVKVEEIEPEK
jgi:hypothetical protein